MPRPPKPARLKLVEGRSPGGFTTWAKGIHDDVGSSTFSINAAAVV